MECTLADQAPLGIGTLESSSIDHTALYTLDKVYFI